MEGMKISLFMGMDFDFFQLQNEEKEIAIDDTVVDRKRKSQLI